MLLKILHSTQQLKYKTNTRPNRACFNRSADFDHFSSWGLLPLQWGIGRLSVAVSIYVRGYSYKCLQETDLVNEGKFVSWACLWPFVLYYTQHSIHHSFSHNVLLSTHHYYTVCVLEGIFPYLQDHKGDSPLDIISKLIILSNMTKNNWCLMTPYYNLLRCPCVCVRMHGCVYPPSCINGDLGKQPTQL